MKPHSLCKPGTEHAHQVALFAWAAMASRVGMQAAFDERCYEKKLYASSFVMEPKAHLLSLMFAIPNGGERNKIVASRLKAEGVKSGVPDICLPVPNGSYHSMYIELKKPKNGVVSKAQTQWLRELVAQDHCAVVCYGWEAAAKALYQYLK